MSIEDLRGANLRGADLSWADLCRADLRDANLRGADLRGANIDFASWPLWCGSKDVITDDRQKIQLLAHVAVLAGDITDPDLAEIAEIEARPGFEGPKIGRRLKLIRISASEVHGYSDREAFDEHFGDDDGAGRR